MKAELQKMLEESIIDGTNPNRNDAEEPEYSIGNNDTIQPDNRSNAADSMQTELQKQAMPTTPKRTSSKQRKESLEEYRETFLQVPTLEDRKHVYSLAEKCATSWMRLFAV